MVENKEMTRTYDSVALWWDFRERRIQAQEQYQKTGDVGFLNQAKYLQGLMDAIFNEDILNNK